MGQRILTFLVAVSILFLGGGVSYYVYQQQNEELISSASKDLGEAREIFKETLTRVFKPATVVYQTVADSRITHADEDSIK